MSHYPFESTPLFQKLLPEVQSVASDMPEYQTAPITDDEAKAITQRICEERKEDALEFWLFLTDVEQLNDDDDWSDANGCIESLIRKHLQEKEASVA